MTRALLLTICLAVPACTISESGPGADGPGDEKDPGDTAGPIGSSFRLVRTLTNRPPCPPTAFEQLIHNADVERGTVALDGNNPIAASVGDEPAVENQDPPNLSFTALEEWNVDGADVNITVQYSLFVQGSNVTGGAEGTLFFLGDTCDYEWTVSDG